MNNLKPCICGGTPQHQEEITGDYFKCPDCSYESGLADTYDWAVLLWNSETAARAEAQKLGVKPCPFCGRMPSLSRIEGGSFEICCWADCPGEAVVQAYSKELAIHFWNGRPLEEALETRVKELETELAAADYLDAEASIGAKELLAENARLKAGLTAARKSILDLMADSEGVAGLHRNGDIADWEWLIDNGWLPWMEDEK